VSDLIIQETAISERGGGAKIDILLSDTTSASPEPTETIRFSVEVNYTGYPRLIEAQILALQRVRDVVGAQIQRTSDILSQTSD
jgi:hypothetical protein